MTYPVNRSVQCAAIALSLVVVAAVCAPWLTPFDPGAQLDIVALKNGAPSWSHWLGTDPYSRDIASRALFGARTSLGVASLATIIATIIGVVWGAVAAVLHGRIGLAMMSTVDVLRSVPRLLFFFGALVVLGVFNSLGLSIVLGASAWAGTSRLVFVRVAELNTRPFVESARALGATPWRVLRQQVVPHLLGPLAASGILLFADMLALESGLSFLGVGVRPPTASWGNMVQDAVPYLRSAWWLAAVPCVLLMTTVLAAATIADHLTSTPSAPSRT